MLRDKQLIKILLDLNLPSEDYAIFGSGPMMAHGIKEANDLDLIVRNNAWKIVQKEGTPPEIEAWNSWGPGKWDIDKLIDEAEVIEGIRFVRLAEVLKWKKMVNRPKDADHIKMIEQYLNKTK